MRQHLQVGVVPRGHLVVVLRRRREVRVEVAVVRGRCCPLGRVGRGAAAAAAVVVKVESIHGLDRNVISCQWRGDVLSELQDSTRRGGNSCALLVVSEWDTW